MTESVLPAAPTRTTVSAAVKIALAALFLYRISVSIADPDLYHQLSLAREALRSGAIPRADVFAFTPTHPVVVHHEWGAALVAYLVATTLGGPGILALRYALAALIAGLALRTARRGGADLAAVALAAPVAIGLADWGFSPVRAQLYTFVGVAFTLACLERDREGARRWMLAHAVALLVWANLHGGFLISFLLLGAYVAESALVRRRFRHVLALATVEAAVVVANPWGAAYPAYLARALAMPRPRVAEWAPLLSPRVPPAHLVAFIVALLLLAYGVWRARPRSAAGLPAVALTGAMALRGHRFLPIFAIAWMVTTAPILARTPLAALARSTFRRAPRAVAGAVGALALVLLFLFARGRPWSLEVPTAPPSLASDGLAYPAGATRFLRASGFRGKLMTPFSAGAYVTWKLHPDVRVSLDGRYEAAFPEPVVADVLAFYDGTRPAAEILARYGPDAVLMPRAAYPLRAAIGWPTAYDDGAFAVLVRPDLPLATAVGSAPPEETFP